MEVYVARRDEIIKRTLNLNCKKCSDYPNFQKVAHYECQKRFLEHRYQLFVDLSKLVREYMTTILMPLEQKYYQTVFCDCKLDDGSDAGGECILVGDNWEPCEKNKEMNSQFKNELKKTAYLLLHLFTDSKNPCDCGENTWGCGAGCNTLLNDVFLEVFKREVDDKTGIIHYDTDSNDGCLYFVVEI